MERRSFVKQLTKGSAAAVALNTSLTSQATEFLLHDSNAEELSEHQGRGPRDGAGRGERQGGKEKSQAAGRPGRERAGDVLHDLGP